MAHEINSSDRFGEVRTGGKRAWHGLGVEIPEGLSAVGGFRKLGIDWGTELLPVYADRMTANGVERIEDPSSRLHIRTDTGDVLGMVSDGYVKLDNLELAEFADAILGEDAAPSLETAMTLCSGRRVIALLRFPQSLIVAKGDEVAQYLAVTSGHGGVAALAVYPTAIRIVCRNTQRLSEKDMSRGVRFLHTGDLAGKLRSAKLALGFAQKELAAYGEQAKAMARKQLTAEQVRGFMADTFAAAFPAPSVAGMTDSETGKELIAKWNAKREEVYAEWRKIYAAERNAMESIRGSIWQAFNTVTEWHDHCRGRHAEGSEERAAFNIFGASQVAKARTLKLATALI